MSATNRTANYDLSQFTSDDITSWLVDYNGDMTKIDTQMKVNANSASSAQTTANSAVTKAETNTESITTLNTQINGDSGIAVQLTQAKSNINTIEELIGNGTPTTTDKTIIGAINELNAEITAPDADTVVYDNATSGLTATNVQDAIDELSQYGTLTNIATVSFSSTETLSNIYNSLFNAISDITALTNSNGGIIKIYDTTSDNYEIRRIDEFSNAHLHTHYSYGSTSTFSLVEIYISSSSSTVTEYDISSSGVTVTNKSSTTRGHAGTVSILVF